VTTDIPYERELGITRVLVAYERDPGEDLVGEWMLKGIDAAELRRLFGARDDDPMYDCWPVAREHVERLTVAVDHELDLEHYDYFVEAFRHGEEGDPRCPPRVLPAFPDFVPTRPRTPA
jgi:hypothetical protein